MMPTGRYQRRQLPRLLLVSILVLLDDAYRLWEREEILPRDVVSILVLLDDAYRQESLQPLGER